MERLYEAMFKINETKKVNRRILTKEEIAMILKEFGIKGFLAKRKILKEGVTGLSNIEDLVEAYSLIGEDITKEELEFLILSITAANKKLKATEEYLIDREEGISEEAAKKLADDRANLIVLSERFNLTANEYSDFKENHKEEYLKAAENQGIIIR